MARPVQIHRFNWMVAIAPPEGPTFYVFAEDAEAIAQALLRVVDELGRGVEFKDSTVGTWRQRRNRTVKT